MYRIEEEIVPPISVFEWIVTFCILFIPLLNVIMLVFWSFAKGVNPNKANWAKGMIIMSVLGTAAWFLFFRALFAH